MASRNQRSWLTISIATSAACRLIRCLASQSTRLYIKMVGRLIQNQQVMISKQQSHERGAATLTAAQAVQRRVKINVSQQVRNDRPGIEGWRPTRGLLRRRR